MNIKDLNSFIKTHSLDAKAIKKQIKYACHVRSFKEIDNIYELNDNNGHRLIARIINGDDVIYIEVIDMDDQYYLAK